MKILTQNKIFAWFILLFICQDIFASQSLGEQRTLYVKVEQALKQGQRTLFVQRQDSLRDYPLYPYLLYADMSRRIAYVRSETIVEFLSLYDATPVADKLRYQWLKHLAAENDWRLFVRHYRSSAYKSDNALACFYAQSLLHARRLDELRNLVRQLWLVDFSQPPECDAVFLWAKQTRAIDYDLIWQRILLVVKSGRLRLADYLAKQLDADTRKWYALLKQSYYHPFKTLGEIENYSQHSPFLRQILLYSLARAQAQDLHKAHTVWHGLRRDFKLYPSLYEQASKELGITACRRLEPEIGLYYLSSLTKVGDDENLYYWRIRCALRLQRWETVLETVAVLNDEDSTSSRWLYWKARALERLGSEDEATAIWKSIASEASYYGYLAADRIGAAYALSAELPKIEARTLNKIRDSATMKRVYEFFRLARDFDARRELLYLLPHTSRDERIGIALLCKQWGRSTCAIEALAEPSFWHKELELRFPMPYRDLVADEARRNDLSEHWIYAVMRRESAFMEEVKSSAGALGLMQLMPATARRTAKNLGLNYSSGWALLQPKLNIRLGSRYLKQMYLLNDRNWVSALASYNAGYHRVKQWKSQAPVNDTDIWIETIPFTETRRYARAVLFYAVVYHYKLHRKMIRLGTLVPTF